MIMNYNNEYKRWLTSATADADVATELKAIENDPAKIEDAFYRNLAFGTGGLRGTIGAGTNRMNVYTVAKASQGLANYLVANFDAPSVSIGYDSRIKSDVFAKVAYLARASSGAYSVICHKISWHIGWGHGNSQPQSKQIQRLQGLRL